MTEDMKRYRYIFGPVPSRRLGRSLGVDVVPFKTCSLDCVYCQLGRSTQKTVEIKEYVRYKDVLAELMEKLKNDPAPDYITLSGSGEPTLYSRLGDLIKSIKDESDVPVAVLTNGSLFSIPEVRERLFPADLVIPSLDAGDSQKFNYVNRPHPDINFDSFVQGLIDFGREFNNHLWIEVFLLGGVTGLEPEVQKIAEIVDQIKPEKVQLNTVARPPAEDYAFSVNETQLKRLLSIFSCPAEIIADRDRIHAHSSFKASHEEVLNLISRRPVSVEDISSGLGYHINESIKFINDLKSKGMIDEERRSGRVYYKLAQPRR